MQRTPLHDFHTRQGAKMVDFAGWEMPLLYTSIVEEHSHTRTAGSLFDVSHMGRIELRGGDALSLLEKVCTRRLTDAEPGQSRYSMICNERGGILDDVIVSRYEDHWLVVCNASNREKILGRLERHAAGRDVSIEDKTESTIMVALQGPKVIDRLAGLHSKIAELRRYRFLTGGYMGFSYTVFRSGYTGEDGVEVIAPAAVAPLLVGFLPSLISSDDGLKPAGLGARDTLRLEAGMPLYGHELNEETDPISAGQAWCVDLEKDFVGAEAIRPIAEKGPERVIFGLEIQSKRIAREHAAVYAGDREIGRVTSGSVSPTLGKSIAMAYLDREHATHGELLHVVLGSNKVDAVATQLPFYKRSRK